MTTAVRSPTVCDNDALRVFLRFGFPPSAQGADVYLNSVLANLERSGCAYRSIGEAMEAVLGRIAISNPTKKLVIPLTSGLDSRCLLGAALSVAPSERLSCVTYGHDESADVSAAQHICRTLGLHWRHIDPNKVEWNLEKIIKVVRHLYNLNGCYPSPEIAKLIAIEESYEGQAIFLSGYLGDALSGSHILTKNHNDSTKTLRAFIRKNETLLAKVDYNEQLLLDVCGKTIKRWGHLRKKFPGLTLMDIVDLGYRQGARIKGSVAGYSHVVCPFESPAIVALWLNRTVEDRSQQALYRRELVRSYPHVFFLRGDKRSSPVRYAGQLVKSWAPSPVERVLRRRRHAPFHETGNPAVNRSMHQVLNTLLRSADQRRIIDNLCFQPFLSRMATEQSAETWDYVIQAARVELNLLAGACIERA